MYVSVDEAEMTFEEFESFLMEGTIMIDFKHENVLPLLGVVYESGTRPLVVLPYMEKGDLLSFVKQDNLVNFILCIYMCISHET